VTQRVLPGGTELDALRTGNFEVALIANCHGVPNPLLDVQTFLPTYAAAYGYYQDQAELDVYDKMLRETDFAKQRAMMRDFEKYVVDEQAHQIWVLWWYRIVPYRSYVKGWKISPSHYINQDLATIWLDK
jgi:peptide/nickel transport system substrate-binding protein